MCNKHLTFESQDSKFDDKDYLSKYILYKTVLSKNKLAKLFFYLSFKIDFLLI